MRRFLSVISLIVGLVCLGTAAAACLGPGGVVQAFTGYAATPTIISLALGVVLLALGIGGNIRLSKKEKMLSAEETARRKVKNRRIYILSGVLTATLAVVICLVCGWPSIEKSMKASRANEQAQIAEKLGCDPNAEPVGSASMPEGARYMLYNADKHTFELSPKNQLLDRVTSKPQNASVLVRYHITTENIGAWYTQANVYIAKAYQQTIHVEVIDIASWKLIAASDIKARRFDDSLDDGYTYIVSIYDEDVRKYLNGMFK